MEGADVHESFVFVVNERVIESDFAELVAVFPAADQQFWVDGCPQKFVVNNNEIEAVGIRSLQCLFSGESISIVGSHGLLSGFLGNVTLEVQFLDCSKFSIHLNPPEFMNERRIKLESADLSILSFEALDSLVLTESISTESGDSLLQFILKPGPFYRDLRRHIEIAFVSEDGLSLWDEHFRILSESIWQCALKQIPHPLLPSPPPFDLQVISDLSEVLAQFQGKQFSLVWRGSRDEFKTKEFHRQCDGQRNTLTVS
jgi:hypothetical protein